jgi:signal transduction histidine kinase
VVARNATDGGVDILVEDDGPGIDEESRGRLFEPFFTTKSHGTGLGLVVTREVVEAHGGSIAAEARAPHGTRFVVHLPASVPGAGAGEPRADARGE